MRVNCNHHDGYDFERAFFGYSARDVPPRFRKKGRVQSLGKAIIRVKGCQMDLGWDPRVPKTELASSLFNRVRKNVGRRADLRLFCAVGTPLDLLGIDGFFELKGNIVTIDLTVSRRKAHIRADFLLTLWHFLSNKHYPLGDSIAKRLVSV